MVTGEDGKTRMGRDWGAWFISCLLEGETNVLCGAVQRHSPAAGFPSTRPKSGFCCSAFTLQFLVAAIAKGCVSDILLQTPPSREKPNHRLAWVGRDLKDHVVLSPLPRTVQGGCGCPIPGGIQGQAECGSGQPGLVVGDHAHSRGG